MHNRYTFASAPILYVIKLHIPNNRKNNTNGQERKPGDNDTAVFALFGFAELTCAVIGISFMSGSAHG